MPCTDGGAVYADLDERQAKLDEVTRLLCAVCRRIEDYEGVGIYISNIENGELKTWWEAHKRADARREAQEAEQRRQEEVRRKALAKLTDEERQLVFEKF